MKPRQQMDQGCRRLGIILTPEQLDAFAAYHRLLLDWSRRMNLISRKDEQRIVTHQFLDCLTPVPYLKLATGTSLLDLGSGAGFPGVPLKIVAPQIRLTLLDSKRKRALFLRKLVEVLGLEDVSVVCDRAESLHGREEYQGRFDFVTSRAVLKLGQLIPLALPFLKKGGRLIAYKGRNEISDQLNLAAEVSSEVIQVQFPKERALVFIKKR